MRKFSSYLDEVPRRCIYLLDNDNFEFRIIIIPLLLRRGGKRVDGYRRGARKMHGNRPVFIYTKRAERAAQNGVEHCRCCYWCKLREKEYNSFSTKNLTNERGANELIIASRNKGTNLHDSFGQRCVHDSPSRRVSSLSYDGFRVSVQAPKFSRNCWFQPKTTYYWASALRFLSQEGKIKSVRSRFCETQNKIICTSLSFFIFFLFTSYLEINRKK